MSPTMALRLALFAFLFLGVNGLSLLDRRDVMVQMLSSFAFPSLNVADTGEAKKVAPTDFSGIYRDPKHVEGYRVVRSGGPGLLVVSLQDQPGGATFEVTGTTQYNPKNGETKLDMDLSKWGVSTSLPVVYSPNQLLYVNFCESGETLTKGSILFPDGNVWVKESGLPGVYVDPLKPNGYRVIRELGNGKVSIDTANRSDQKPVNLKAVVNKSKGTLVIDFRPVGGERNFEATIEGQGLSFADGTKWIKL